MRTMNTTTHWAVAGLILASCSAMAAPKKADVPKLTVNPLFSDHAVLQRDVAAPVWGTAPAGTKVTVKFGKQEKSAEAGTNGTWMVKLDPVPVKKEPSDMIVSSGETMLTVKDILVGDVYLCGGQSNMHVKMAEYGRPEDMKVATFPNIRQFDNVDKKPWTECTPETIGGYTAVGFYFARKVNQETGVPIGLVANALGSSRIESWIPEEAYPLMPELLNKDGKPRAQKWDKYGRLYRMHTAYLVPYAIKAMIWYQGEQNIWNNDSENAYFIKMKALIGSYRTLFGVGDFPVYFVQLPCMGAEDKGAAVDGGRWTGVQLAQLRSLAIPSTGMAVALDINTPPSIHPANKVDVGDRLARWALAKDYGKKDLVYSGPLYKGMKVEGNKIRLMFDHAGKGLMAGTKNGYEPVKEVANGKILMFAIAGEETQADGKKALKWVAGDAVIDGETVVVSNPEISNPVAVRYACGGSAFGPMLYNKDGLPCSVFKTVQENVK
jgi:sialate O-acetylesterase